LKQITLIVTKATADWFGKGGIADRYIQVNGYPFLDKEEHSFGVPVSHVMRRDPVVMTASGMKLHEIGKCAEAYTHWNTIEWRKSDSSLYMQKPSSTTLSSKASLSCRTKHR
jgi:hypothetical protein